MHPVDFVRNWTGVTRTERSAAQEHFLQLCRVLGQPTPAEAAKRLNDLRETWLNPADASEAEFKKGTLTNLSNARPTWLAHAHAAFDRAVWGACGGPGEEVPAEVAEDVILARLLELNGERASRS